MEETQRVCHRGVWEGRGVVDSEWVWVDGKDGNNVDWDLYQDQYGNTYRDEYRHNYHDKMEDHWYENGGEYWSGYWS